MDECKVNVLQVEEWLVIYSYENFKESGRTSMAILGQVGRGRNEDWVIGIQRLM